ncbi:N-acetyltransferase [Microbulbifer sp. 2304DJ12-6]|uniref:N-acetyltransferase n=1 Tax=Microbulbifer sp. 2304DJ12-6 TaxID=3233340 RepID=UPI0039B05F9D
MKAVRYLKFDEVNPSDFLPALNRERVRKHLVDHALFTTETLKLWMDSKVEIDSTSGCRVRAIILEGSLVGWCGIQLECDKYAIAMVINDQFWGLGKTVFQDVMGWAKELGHKEIFIHLLHTRPGYKFLGKFAKNIRKTEMYDNNFTEYQLEVK